MFIGEGLLNKVYKQFKSVKYYDLLLTNNIIVHSDFNFVAHTNKHEVDDFLGRGITIMLATAFIYHTYVVGKD